MDGIVGMIKMVLTPVSTAEWLACDGQMLAVADYPALFALTGARFGGDGQTQFALPTVPAQEGTHYVIKARSLTEEAGYQGLVAQIVLWVGDALPNNWLPCDGRLVQGQDYPQLQKVAAQGPNGMMDAFHLPTIAASPGMQYIICVEGLDPNAGKAGAAQDDDDY